MDTYNKNIRILLFFLKTSSYEILLSMRFVGSDLWRINKPQGNERSISSRFTFHPFIPYLPSTFPLKLASTPQNFNWKNSAGKVELRLHRMFDCLYTHNAINSQLEKPTYA